MNSQSKCSMWQIQKPDLGLLEGLGSGRKLQPYDQI